MLTTAINNVHSNTQQVVLQSATKEHYDANATQNYGINMFIFHENGLWRNCYQKKILKPSSNDKVFTRKPHDKNNFKERSQG